MRIDTLAIEDVIRHPIWQFSNICGDPDDIVVDDVPLPTTNTYDRLIACRVIFSNGETQWALIGNISEHNRLFNEHFMTISVYRGDRWINMMRYHDVGFVDDAGAAFASQFGLDPGDIFPIKYDLRELVRGNPEALRGEIAAVPERLSRGELFELALED